MLTLYAFGDSVLDCGRYNAVGLDPGRLLVRNDDRLFPEFRGRDLASRGPARLAHRALDGATVAGAELLGLGPYGVSVGARADLVLVDAECAPEAVAAHPPRLAVIKAGRIVARDGTLLGRSTG